MFNLSPTGIRAADGHLELGLCITGTITDIDIAVQQGDGDWRDVFLAHGFVTVAAGESLKLTDAIDGMTVTRSEELVIAPGDSVSVAMRFAPSSPQGDPLEFQPIFQFPPDELAEFMWLNDVGQASQRPCG